MRCSFIIARDLRSAGTIKKERGNPNDPARFIGKVAVTEDGETAKIYNYLDTEKIEQEALYDGMYAVTTDLLDDDVKDILKRQGRLCAWSELLFLSCRIGCLPNRLISGGSRLVKI